MRKNRFILVMLAVALIFGAALAGCGGPAKAAGASAKPGSKPSPESDFLVKFNDTQDGAVITGYTGPGGNVVIPAVIQDFPVRVIYDLAFRENTTLTSIVIPEGVTHIGYRVFDGCTSLVSITIPESVTEIESRTFVGCKSLTSIVIPEGVTHIGMFEGCTSLTSVVIPESVTEIGGAAFLACKSLTSIVIPEGVTYIGGGRGGGAFQASGLTSVTIPDSVKVIDDYAFFGCDNLVTVTISPVEGREWSNYKEFASCPKLSLASQAAIKAAGYKGRF
jgi:hypothetical protein